MFYNAIEVDCIDNNIITISCLLQVMEPKLLSYVSNKRFPVVSDIRNDHREIKMQHLVCS